MSSGLLTGRRCLSLVLVLALGVAVPAVLSGCGGGDEDEATTRQKPRESVPGGELDSAVVDTGSTTDMESSYEAGTLPHREGVSEDQSPGEPTTPDSGADLKVVPADTEVRGGVSETASGARPATSVSSGEGAYSLQLGSFTNLDNARKQADRISALGYAPVIEESNLGGQTYHRVMLRGVGDMAEASRLGEHIHSEIGIAYLVRRAN